MSFLSPTKQCQITEGNTSVDMLPCNIKLYFLLCSNLQKHFNLFTLQGKQQKSNERQQVVKKFSQKAASQGGWIFHGGQSDTDQLGAQLSAVMLLLRTELSLSLHTPL